MLRVFKRKVLKLVKNAMKLQQKNPKDAFYKSNSMRDWCHVS